MRIKKNVVCILVSIVLAFSTITGFAKPVEQSESDWEEKLITQYETLLPDLGYRADEWEKEYEKCTDEEKKIMQYYFITTSMTDLCSIDFALLHKYATHAVKVRKTFDWAKNLPEDTFLCYVADYKVSIEPTVDYRDFFYDQIVDIVKDKSLTEAALLVNFWCGEQATYSDTDQNEFSPLGMYNSGKGRCGEEAMFVVSALRSVGIPSRVCNVSWTGVPDGHAFPQVLIDGEWHYMGGCEPEPAMDCGWFVDRLGSILTTASYAQSDIGVDGGMVYSDYGYTIVNDIEDFAKTKKVTLTVLDKKGKPLEGARVDIILVQNGVYESTELTVVTDAEGKAKFTLGKGSVSAVCYQDDDFRAIWIDQNQTEGTISFAEEPKYDEWISCSVKYNDAKTKRWQSATDEEKNALFGEKSADDLRAENHEKDFDEKRASKYPDCEDNLKWAGKNFDEIMTFLEKDDDPMRVELVKNVTGRYCGEVSAETLEDILQGAEKVRGELSDKDFVKGILCPVLEWGYFVPQRLEVQELFTEEQISDFRADPDKLKKWFDSNLSDDCIREIKGKNPNLLASIKMGYCPEKYKTFMLMELARTLGIPVSQEEDGDSWYYHNGKNWEIADWSPEYKNGDDDYGTLRYEVPDNNKQYQGLSWACMYYQDNQPEYALYWIVEDDDTDYDMDLPAGDYVIVLLDQTEDTSGTLYYRRVKVEEGKTTSFTLPE